MTLSFYFAIGALSVLVGLVLKYSWIVCKEAHKLYHIEDKDTQCGL